MEREEAEPVVVEKAATPPTDSAAELARALQAAAASGTQLSFQANVWQTLPAHVWTPENAAALIAGLREQSAQVHKLKP